MLDFTKPLIYVDSMKNEYPARFITRINNNNLPNVIVFTRKDGLEAIHMCTDEGSLSRYGQQKIFQAPAPKVSKWVRHFISKDTGELGVSSFYNSKREAVDAALGKYVNYLNLIEFVHQDGKLLEVIIHEWPESN